jgi:hypothetical protein
MTSEGAQYGDIKCPNRRRARRLSVDAAKFRGLVGDTSIGCAEFFTGLLIASVVAGYVGS